MTRTRHLVTLCTVLALVAGAALPAAAAPRNDAPATVLAGPNRCC